MDAKNKIGKRLIFAISLVSVIMGTAAVAGLLALVRVSAGYESTLAGTEFSQENIGEFNTFLNLEGALVRDIILITDEDASAISQEYEAAKLGTQKSFEGMKISCKSMEELTLLREVEASLEQYRQLRDEALLLGKQGQTEKALNIFREKAHPHLLNAVNTAKELRNLNVTMGEAASASLSAQTKISIMTVCLILVIGIVTAILLVCYNAHLIQKYRIES